MTLITPNFVSGSPVLASPTGRTSLSQKAEVKPKSSSPTAPQDGVTLNANWTQTPPKGLRYEAPQPGETKKIALHEDFRHEEPAPASKPVGFGNPEQLLVADNVGKAVQSSNAVGNSLLNSNAGGFMIARPSASTGPAQTASVQPAAHSAEEKAGLVDLVKTNESGDFPKPFDGYYSNYGLDIFLLEGEHARKTVGFAADSKGKDTNYDPARHSVLATVTSDDEPHLGVYVVDRESKEVAFGFHRNTVDLAPDQVQKHFPKVSEINSAFELVGEVAKGGELLEHVVNPGDKADGYETDQLDYASWAPK